MLELNPQPGDKAESERIRFEETVKYLWERSLQLQEYSKKLKQRSQEINQRIQACLNSKASA